MQCPLCRHRPARRGCPALGRQICAACCGSKRLVEIACPGDCPYLAAAQAHPAAVVKKQHEHDVALLTSLMSGLTRPQQELAWPILGFISRFGADPLLRLYDEDVADMATAVSSTLETAARGVIYEHRPRSLVAQRLATDLKAFLQESGQQEQRGFERNVAAALGRVAVTFRDAAKVTGEAGPAVVLSALRRVLRAAEAASRDGAAAEQGQQRIQAPGPSLIRP